MEVVRVAEKLAQPKLHSSSRVTSRAPNSLVDNVTVSPVSSPDTSKKTTVVLGKHTLLSQPSTVSFC